MPDSDLTQIARRLDDAWLRIGTEIYRRTRDSDDIGGLTNAQVYVLLVLESGGACRAGELAQRANMLVPSLSRVLRALEERGLITRTRDESDRRVQHIELSDVGRAEVERRANERREAMASLLESFPADEQHELAEVLERLVDALVSADAPAGTRAT